MLRADEVLVAVEIVSPGSKRTDHVTKHEEYADAGLPCYWIVDLGDPVSVVACHQAGELDYPDAPAVTGVFATSEPFPANIDLTTLTACGARKPRRRKRLCVNGSRGNADPRRRPRRWPRRSGKPRGRGRRRAGRGS
ncbi:Uma2 family endonuclease [Amycolatopsis sp. FDAARGOS 1241]|uniref:Uma2 family endonuclease n=1 Tax=Amycolatopsis sp. FDAARGOS 1241 TaxID=2778070 RepID=UPI00351C9FD7